MSAPLLGVLAELERTRAAVLAELERSVPAPPPPDPSDAAAGALHALLLGARRAVLSSPAAAREVYAVLVAAGTRYAATPEGAELRERLAVSPAVAELRRVWETVTLNVLDGPADPSGVPDAWAELLTDAAAGGALDTAALDAALARLRPPGTA